MPGNHTGYPFHTRKNDKELIPVEKTKRVIKVDNRGRGRKRRRRGSGIRMVGYILCVLPVLLVISAAAAFILYQINISKIQKMADNIMPELRENGDGTYELSWSGLEEAEADVYFVDVSTDEYYSENGKRTFFSGYVDGVSCQLPELPMGEALVLEMELIKNYSVFGKEHTLKLATIHRYFFFRNPMVKIAFWEVDPDAGIAYISFDFQGADSCRVYVTEPDGEKKFLRTVDENILELNLYEEEELWIPTPGNPCVLTFVPGNRVNGMALYGGESRELTVSWEDFAARDIQLALEVFDGCVAYLEWSKVDCDFYEIQMMDNDLGSWETIKTVARDDECRYTTPRLSPGAGYSFRVAAELADYTAVSEVQECEIDITPLYCTIWPVKDLKAYSDPAKSSVVGEVKTLDALCVVDVQDGMFGVNVDGSIGYIDRNYCMINLPEYVGSLCSYDITNSYDSIFMAHGFEVPGLTGQVITGFENVRLADNSFLVPLLYPTTKKLEKAMENAKENGYRLKIYESFRPHKASAYMYQKATAVQYTPLPENTYLGVNPGVILTVQERDENGTVTERRKTYWELMNGSNNFTMTYFVSAGVSKHNLGVAMDLTLEDLDTGYEVAMQTDLHDLSQYSARAQNSAEARQLSNIMMSAGFTDLISEWWHFQDDDIRSKLSLPSVNDGVKADCWMTNGFGWRYRNTDGSYAVNCTLTIDGMVYTFDSDGYVRN